MPELNPAALILTSRSVVQWKMRVSVVDLNRLGRTGLSDKCTHIHYTKHVSALYKELLSLTFFTI